MLPRAACKQITVTWLKKVIHDAICGKNNKNRFPTSICIYPANGKKNQEIFICKLKTLGIPDVSYAFKSSFMRSCKTVQAPSHKPRLQSCAASWLTVFPLDFRTNGKYKAPFFLACKEGHKKMQEVTTDSDSYLLVPVKQTAHVPVGSVSWYLYRGLTPASRTLRSNIWPNSSRPIQPMKVVAFGTPINHWTVKQQIINIIVSLTILQVHRLSLHISSNRKGIFSYCVWN